MRFGENISEVDIETDDFAYFPARAVVACAREKNKVDVVLAKAYASEVGWEVTAAELSEMISTCPTSNNFDYYVKALKRELYEEGIYNLNIEASKKLADGAEIETVTKLLTDGKNRLEMKYSGQLIDGSIYEDMFDLLQAIEERRDPESLTPTGFLPLDNMHGGGFLPNELIILAARPSVGKTALALQIALDCNQKVCFFSLEMNKRQVSVRLLSNISGKSAKLASRNPKIISEEDRQAFLGSINLLNIAADRISVFDEPNQTVDSIRQIAKHEVMNGAKLIIIDYIQLISSNHRSDSREREVAEFSRSLKNLSKELNTPILVLAQLSRQCEVADRAPRLSDLRESGAIEQDANSVIFLHDTGKKSLASGNKIVSLILAKGRDVGTGFANCVFNGAKQRFYEARKEEVPS